VKTTAGLAAAALALLAGGCSDDPREPAARSGAPAAVATTSDRPTLEQVVADPGATLSDVTVRPGPDGLVVHAWWVLRRHGHTFGAIVTSDDRMETASYAPGTYRAWSAHEPRVTRPSPAPGMGGLLTSDILSLQDGTRAQQGGHDGATLAPFERLVRSVGGGPWERFDVPMTHGQQAYTGGQVVLPDGRLLALLDAWSGDRRGRENPVWHGLWISAGDDWASYRPWRPAFTPALPAPQRPWGPLLALGASLDRRQTTGPVVWVSTLDRLYVSTDGAQTFREVAARPATG
jgi:hypothetical protein